VRGLIEVSTFKANVVPRAGDIIYLFTPHSITVARPQNWLRAAPLPRDRDSRRYLHANSFQTRFRMRKNPHHGESGPRACEWVFVLVPVLTRVEWSPLTFDPRFDPRFPSSPSSSGRVILYCRRLDGP